MAHAPEITIRPNLDLAEQRCGLYQGTVPEHLCVGLPDQQFLFGGCALAAAIEAIERATERPVIQASAQFVTPALPGQTLVFAPAVVASGHAISQASLVATAGDRLVLVAHGSAGQRSHATVHQAGSVPSVLLPGECRERSVARLLSSKVNDLFEFRLAAGEWPDRAGWTGSGHLDSACWVGLRSGAAVTRQVLPVIADCAALGLASALGRPASGTSLDNSIRFAGAPDEERVLLSTRVESIRNGIAHVTSRIYGCDLRLLALADQSMILRMGPSAIRP